MTGIVEFLTARLDEDEALALGVSEGPRKPEVWEAKQWPYGTFPRNWAVDCPFGAVVVGGSFKASAIHIPRHDPARVLREVKAKRERLALYVEVTDILFHGKSGDRIKYQRESGRFEALDGEVRRDAALYADHPDYDPAWRVE